MPPGEVLGTTKMSHQYSNPKQKTNKSRVFWKARKSKFRIRGVPKRMVPRGGPFQVLDRICLLFTPPKRRPGADFIRRIRFLWQFCRLKFVLFRSFSGSGRRPWGGYSVYSLYLGHTNKNRDNFFKKLQSRDDFCDIMCTDDVLCQIDCAGRVESTAGRGPWSGQNVDSLYLHHTN